MSPNKQPCPVCLGDGKVLVAYGARTYGMGGTGEAQLHLAEPCPGCGGSGIGFEARERGKPPGQGPTARVDHVTIQEFIRRMMRDIDKELGLPEHWEEEGEEWKKDKP